MAFNVKSATDQFGWIFIKLIPEFCTSPPEKWRINPPEADKSARKMGDKSEASIH
jgi:hypothetical protein